MRRPVPPRHARYSAVIRIAGLDGPKEETGMQDHSRMQATTVAQGQVIGLDLSDKQGTFVELDAEGRLVREGKVALTEAGLRTRFGEGAPCRIALEVGTHSPWVSR